MDGSHGEIRPSVQAHLVRATKYSDNKPKNWSIFCFFRVMRQGELDATALRMKNITSPGEVASAVRAASELLLDFEKPSWAPRTFDPLMSLEGNGGAPASRPPSWPAAAFFAWLSVVAEGKKDRLLATAHELLFGGPFPEGASLPTVKVDEIKAIFEGLIQAFDGTPTAKNFEMLAGTAIGWLANPANYAALLKVIGEDPASSGLKALTGGLAGVLGYELLRQGAPAFSGDGDKGAGIVRSEFELGADIGSAPIDRAPINIAFTHSGLTALQLHPATLASFPDEFRQGMAARAERLGDVGQSAPENWEGELGQKSVHGFFSGGFLIDDPAGVDEVLWRKLRSEVRAFNDPACEVGRKLRTIIGAMARLLGIEILHIELGQDPYEVDEKGKAHRLPYRYEHFGFRDGISQPFADIGLEDSGAGGGTPARNRTWAPVAAGEIYLDRRDEDGLQHLLPVNPDLRRDGTYLVFRKLEQDVVGFRSFLAKQRPGSAKAQDALAAQFVGRWKNGTPLVLSPDSPRNYDEAGPRSNDPAIQRARARKEEAAINDFLYASDDPRGRKCPLSAHIRRTNPRDTGGRNDVRRHRILRRGMSYGGPLLNEDSIGDGESRGILFIAANSRIDIQFETIQAEWINGGEFMGQAGLGRCPLTGAHSGKKGDTFLEAGAVAPLNGLPAFVHTRGGDYFFAPGVETLRQLAREQKFGPVEDKTPFGGYTMNDPVTPGLFDASRVQKYARLIMTPGGYNAVKVELPEPLVAHDGPSNAAAREAVVFVGRYDDVRRVLMGRDGSSPVDFSVEHYRTAMDQMTRGNNFLVGTDQTGPTAALRSRMLGRLKEAWLALGNASELEQRVREIARSCVEASLRRCASTRRVDLVRDFAAEATYAVLSKLFGTPGPNWITELALALPFSRANVGGLHEEWLAARRGDKPDNPPFLTMQIWSTLVLADLIGNIYNMRELKELSRKAALEKLAHVDNLIARARANPPPTPQTLVDGFVATAPADPKKAAQHYRDAALLLAELAGTALTVVPLTFASVMTTIFGLRLDLARLVQILISPPAFGAADPGNGLRRLIYEAERFNPNMAIRMRKCEADVVLPSGAPVKAGDWIACIMKAAMLTRFEEPEGFSLFPYLPGKERRLDDYLLFGAVGSNRDCWGRDKIAVIILEECLKGAGRLHGLRRVAGERGEVRRLLNVAIGLQARFVDVSSPKAPMASNAQGLGA